MALAFATFLGLCVFGLAVYLLQQMQGRSLISPVRRSGGAPKRKLVRIEGPGEFRAEVVGESHYQHQLAQLCGGHRSEGYEKHVEAFLLLEDGNEYDSNAVAVAIDDEIVGHLPRKLAQQYRQLLRDGGFGDAPAIVQAVIKGGFIRSDGELGHFGVKLDLHMSD